MASTSVPAISGTPRTSRLHRAFPDTSVCGIDKIRDPHPTYLTIQSYLAERLDKVSPARVAMERKALHSFFKFLHSAGLRKLVQKEKEKKEGMKRFRRRKLRAV